MAAQLSADGRPLLSWRVFILPYLDREAEILYSEFHLDEPWDSVHNLPLAARMPKVFAPPRVEGLLVEPRMTFYQAIVGRGAAFEPGRPLKLTSEEFPDGTSNTLMLVEAAHPVIWTAPDDVAYDADQPAPELGGIFNMAGRFSFFGENRKKGFNAAFADGRTQFFPAQLSPVTLRALLTRDGGEKLPDDE